MNPIKPTSNLRKEGRLQMKEKPFQKSKELGPNAVPQSGQTTRKVVQGPWEVLVAYILPVPVAVIFVSVLLWILAALSDWIRR
jgi:hypothetical protein